MKLTDSVPPLSLVNVLEDQTAGEPLVKKLFYSINLGLTKGVTSGGTVSGGIAGKF